MNEEKKQNRDFERLKQIGVEQIKKDTKLDLARIADILEKRFEKFDYVRAKGFINILEKEYKLDLSDWLEEYHLSNPTTIYDEDTQEIQEEYCKQLKQKKQIFISIIIGIICLVVPACLYLLKNNTPQQETVVHQTLNTQDSPNSSEVLHDPSTQESIETSKENAQTLDTQTTEAQTNPKTNQNSFTEKSTSKLGSLIFKDLIVTQESVLSLQFERAIWVGAIELESKKRSAQTQEEYQFSLNKDMLFYIAYGSFLLSVDGKEKKYKTYNPIFLIYTQEGGLKQLTKDEYLFINGGLEW